jgi:hypothetical protein
MSEQDHEPQGPWRFIGMDQFHLPPEPAREKMRRGLLGIWDRLREADRRPNRRLRRWTWKACPVI